MQVKVTFEDSEWALDIDEMDLGEARTIQRATGFGLADFAKGALIDANADALAWLYWLMKKQNGVTPLPDPNRVNFKVLKFAAAVLSAHEEAAKKAQEEEESGKDDEGAGQATGSQA